MKIGLIDIDSKIPNLALMKISAYFKAQGDQVKLTSPLFANQFDELFASKIFNYTEKPILPEKTIKGGSGYSLEVMLDEDMENLMPDYSIYNCNYAMGFTSRGCNRNCPFCIVPRKEGKWRAVCDIRQFWNEQDKIRLLDNSLNTDEDHFSLILNQLIENKIETDFDQGLDIRYLTDNQAQLLSKVRLWKRIHFAWDFMETEPFVRRGISILYHHNLRRKSMFYVLIGYNTTQEEDLYRIEELQGLGIDPFAMPYDKFDRYQKDFARWVNHKAIFKSVKWENYNGSIKNAKR